MLEVAGANINLVIREIQLAAGGRDEDEFYEPPSRVLILSVIGGEAFMRVHSFGEAARPSDEPLCGFQVNARSLLLALQAAIDDPDS